MTRADLECILRLKLTQLVNVAVSLGHNERQLHVLMNQRDHLKNEIDTMIEKIVDLVLSQHKEESQ